MLARVSRCQKTLVLCRLACTHRRRIVQRQSQGARRIAFGEADHPIRRRDPRQPGGRVQVDHAIKPPT